MKNIHPVLALVALGSFTSVASAGIYSGPSDTTNAMDPAIASTDPRFTEWADAIDSTRTNFAPGGSTTIDQAGGLNFFLEPGQGVGVINAISIPEPSGMLAVGSLMVVGLLRRQNRHLSKQDDAVQ